MSDKNFGLASVLDTATENYLLLMMLLPDLHNRSVGPYTWLADGAVPVQIEVLEQTRYTTQVHMTQAFECKETPNLPDVVLRLYHDSQTLDVVSLQQGRFARADFSCPVGLEYRLQINVFLRKWFEYLESLAHAKQAEAVSLTS